MRFPTSYGQLTVKQFLKVYDILESNLDAFDKRMEIISYFLECDANEIPFKQTGLKRFYKRNLSGYLAKAEKLINSPKPLKVRNTIYIGNKRYYTSLDAEALNTNQYTAFATYTQNGQGEKNLAKCLALLYYRHKFFTTPKFDSTKLKEIEADIMNARLCDVYGTLVFFCNVVEQLNAIFPCYLMEVEMMIEKEIKQILTQVSDSNTDGITS